MTIDLKAIEARREHVLQYNPDSGPWMMTYSIVEYDLEALIARVREQDARIRKLEAEWAKIQAIHADWDEVDGFYQDMEATVSMQAIGKILRGES